MQFHMVQYLAPLDKEKQRLGWSDKGMAIYYLQAKAADLAPTVTNTQHKGAQHGIYQSELPTMPW